MEFLPVVNHEKPVTGRGQIAPSLANALIIEPLRLSGPASHPIGEYSKSLNLLVPRLYEV